MTAVFAEDSKQQPATPTVDTKIGIEGVYYLRYAKLGLIPLAANERYSRSGFRKVSTDMAVPVERFHSLLKFYEDTCGPSGIDHIIFGHIGDCHLHLNLFPKTEDEATRSR